jgi:hypothetical protein
MTRDEKKRYVDQQLARILKKVGGKFGSIVICLDYQPREDRSNLIGAFQPEGTDHDLLAGMLYLTARLHERMSLEHRATRVKN